MNISETFTRERPKTTDLARGRWRDILPLLGIDPAFLVNKHGPCPLCGGRDRFRFDDKEGNGTYYCNQCGAGNGVTLLRKRFNWDFKTVCSEIDRVLGAAAPVTRTPRENTERKRVDRLSRIKRILDEATEPEIVRSYLIGRGLSTFPEALRGHRALAYMDDAGNYLGKHQAVIAPVIGPDGQLQSAHRIYLADYADRKKSMPPVDTINGAAVRLFEPGEVLGLSEGIETGLAVHELFHIPVWAALSANGIESFVPPAGLRCLVIYGDNDANFHGQKAAYTLANRLVRTIEIEVSIPRIPGTDWLDVLNSKGRSASS